MAVFPSSVLLCDLKSKTLNPLQVAELLKLLEVRRSQEGDDDFIECNNMTLINLVLKFLGPTHERTLTVIMLIIQVCVRPLWLSRHSLKCVCFTCVSSFLGTGQCSGFWDSLLLGAILLWHLDSCPRKKCTVMRLLYRAVVLPCSEVLHFLTCFPAWGSVCSKRKVYIHVKAYVAEHSESGSENMTGS